MALFWPRRWHISFRIEVIFAFILTGLAVYADQNSSATFHAYESDLPVVATVAVVPEDATPAAFDRMVTVLAFQWGF